MLVMSNGHLQLRDAGGADHDVRWPTGFAVETDPIRVVDRSGSAVAVQGHETSSLNAAMSAGIIDVCEV
jgi:hypothetical protein